MDESERSTGELAGSGRLGRNHVLLLILCLVILPLLIWQLGQSLGLRNDPLSMAARQLQDPESPRRIGAIGQLERFGRDNVDVAIPALTKSLDDPQAEVREAAAMALVMVVHEAATDGSHGAVVKQAIAALFEHGHDSEARVRASSIQSLWMITSMWSGPTPIVEIAMVEEMLLRATGDPEAIVRVAAVKGLGVIGPKVVDEPPPVLLSALDDGSPAVRVAASEALAQFRDRLVGSFPGLIRSFEKARPEARGGYSALLARIRPKAFTSKCLPALGSAMLSPDEEIRSVAALSFVEFAGPKQSIDPESFAAVASILRAGKPEVRLAVATALGRFSPSPAFIPALGEAARDPDELVRAASLQSLDEIGHKLPFVPPDSVAAALEDRSPKVRYWAAGAIGHAGLGLDPYIPALLRHAEHDSDAEVRVVCADELREFIKAPAITPTIIPILLEALKSTDESVRCAVTAMLGSLGADSAAAIPTILRFLKPGETSETRSRAEIRQRAATALGEIAPGTTQAKEAAQALIETLQVDPPGLMTLAWVKALTRFGPLARPAIPKLRELEKSTDSTVASFSKVALEALEP